MLFNSFEYIIFFPLIVLFYFSSKNIKTRTTILLIGSYIFYASWNPVYLVLLLFSTTTSFLLSKLIHKSDGRRKDLFLYFAIFLSLILLFYFKYYNFIARNLQFIIDRLHLPLEVIEHSWLLPVGISFYTFQIVGYLIDVAKGRIEPEKSYNTYSLYVSFFPQLVAGPIERATQLLPQLKKIHRLNYNNFSNGFRLILWGFFKKLVVADRFALYVNQIYNDPESYSGMPIVMATIFFVFQVYCDFSAYSDIAIGSARVLGIELMENFKGPLLSKNVTEIWRRWHISLSTWIRDYLYNPILIKTRHWEKKGLVFTLILTFSMVGIWHGAEWTFVIFGFVHGLALTYELLSKKTRKKWRKHVPKVVYNSLSIAITFIFWSATCLLFRANNLHDASTLLTNIFVSAENSWNANIFTDPKDITQFKISLGILIFMILFHFVEYKKDATEFFNHKSIVVRVILYLMVGISIPIFGAFNAGQQFIYFQF